MKNQRGFAVLAFALIIAAAGALATGTVKFQSWHPSYNKQAASTAFKSGKPSDWTNLNK